MRTQELFNVLQQHQDKSLLFEYLPNQLVGANYHITEVKHVAIDAVDCGANSDSWNETIIQLWESPKEVGKTEYMTTYKALAILNKVAKMKPFNMTSEVKFEYSNNTFHTAHLFVNDYEINGSDLILKLAVKKTDCKAKSECGVTEDLVVEAMQGEPCCTPEGNCC